MKTKQGILLAALLACAIMCAQAAVGAAGHTYYFNFNDPMSWADDTTPWGNSDFQEWEIADGGKPGKCLRITGETYGRMVSYEIRTLQFNHQPNTPVTIRLDLRDVNVPPGSLFMIRHFDGYCGGQAFHWVADDQFRPFPEPLWDSRKAKLTGDWQTIECRTPQLKNTVVTFAFIVRQPKPDTPPADPEYVEFRLDNLKVGITPLDKLMDPDFDWHGNYGGSTVEFRHNTLGANADWCDFADQEVAVAPDGKGRIRYSLFQFRDATTQKNPGTRHVLAHEEHALGVGGCSAIRMNRWIGAGKLSAASWGVRQTVSYEALGLGPDETARIRVTMKMTQLDHDDKRASRVQLGVDPLGGAVTREAMWTTEEKVCLRHDGIWITPSVEFQRPAGANAFTVYFRQRDGIAQDAPDKSYPPDPKEQQSRGTDSTIDAYADWVMVEVIK